MAKETRQKLRKNFEEVQQAKETLLKLPKKIIVPRSVTYNKATHSIEVLKGFRTDENFNTFQFVYRLENFPSWAIPMTRVTHVFYSEDMHSFDPNNPDFIDQTFGFTIWKEVEDAENTYDIFMESGGSLRRKRITPNGFTFDIVPTFLDLTIHIRNEKIYNEVQHNKT